MTGKSHIEALLVCLGTVGSIRFLRKKQPLDLSSNGGRRIKWRSFVIFSAGTIKLRPMIG